MIDGNFYLDKLEGIRFFDHFVDLFNYFIHGHDKHTWDRVLELAYIFLYDLKMKVITRVHNPHMYVLKTITVCLNKRMKLDP